MKTCTITAALVTLCVASSHAVNPTRKRTKPQHKSMSKARALSDESYDPYLGIENRQLAGSMSVSMSMSMSPTATPPTDKNDSAPMEDSG